VTIHDSDDGNVLYPHEQLPTEMRHEVMSWCKGERCSMCNADATHKVEEERSATLDRSPGLVGRYHVRHPFTAYVCCACFGRIFGPAAAVWCSGANL
jgi:hypothetical protein